MTALHGPPAVVDAIGIAAGRIRRYGEAIAQGHEFGIDPGTHHQLWTLDYQRAATPIYAETLPWTYLTKLAASFSEIATQMLTLEAPADATSSWNIIHGYLRSATTAIGEIAPTPLPTLDPVVPPTIDPTTPPLMRFGRLAAICHGDGTAELIDAASAVERLCGASDTCPLSEQEKTWIHCLIRGDRVIDIANQDGYSERTMYRALNDLWARMGVNTRTEAIALATENGWLT